MTPITSTTARGTKIVPAMKTIYWWVKDEDIEGETQRGELTGIRAGVTLVQAESKAEVAIERNKEPIKPIVDKIEEIKREARV